MESLGERAARKEAERAALIPVGPDPNDPHRYWNGQAWLRWDGEQWVPEPVQHTSRLLRAQANLDAKVEARKQGAELQPVAATSVEKQSWGSKRDAKKADKQHTAALAAWQSDQDMIDRALTMATYATTGRGIDSNIMLKAGEVALWSGPGRLIEPRRGPGHYKGRSQGISVPIGHGVRYRTGASRGTFIAGDEVQTVVDSGTVTVTTTRVIFSGGNSTREWTYAKVVDMETSTDRALTLIHVSNRQKVSGVRSTALLSEALGLGLTIFQNDAGTVRAALEDEVRQHELERP